MFESDNYKHILVYTREREKGGYVERRQAQRRAASYGTVANGRRGGESLSSYLVRRLVRRQESG